MVRSPVQARPGPLFYTFIAQLVRAFDTLSIAININMSITNQKGYIGEQAFALEAAKRGYWVAQMPQDCPYDFILDKRDGNLIRVQVKYRSLQLNGTISLRLKNGARSNRANYSSNNIDMFAVYVAEKEETFLIPISEIQDMDEISIRVEPPKNNQKKGVRLIQELNIW